MFVEPHAAAGQSDAWRHDLYFDSLVILSPLRRDDVYAGAARLTRLYLAAWLHLDALPVRLVYDVLGAAVWLHSRLYVLLGGVSQRDGFWCLHL